MTRGGLGVPQAWPHVSSSLACVCTLDPLLFPSLMLSSAVSCSTPGKAFCIRLARARGLPHAPSHLPLFMGQLFPFREN